MRTTDMLETYPGNISIDRELLARAIDSLAACSQTCTACADACLAEDSVADLRDCIGADLICAEICATTASVLSRNTGFHAEVAGALLHACIEACRSCGDECEEHAHHHDHCRICAEACRECERACSELLASL